MPRLWMVPTVKELRYAWMRAVISAGVARQIRGLRKARGWTQKELANALGTSQAVVARYENPLYGKQSIHSLMQIAQVFDVALIIRFSDWVTFVTAYGTFDVPAPYSPDQTVTK